MRFPWPAQFPPGCPRPGLTRAARVGLPDSARTRCLPNANTFVLPIRYPAVERTRGDAAITAISCLIAHVTQSWVRDTTARPGRRSPRRLGPRLGSKGAYHSLETIGFDTFGGCGAAPAHSSNQSRVTAAREIVPATPEIQNTRGHART